MTDYIEDTIQEIRKDYATVQWANRATDSQIIRAWRERSDEWCAGWLSYTGPDEDFELYLHEEMEADEMKEIYRLYKEGKLVKVP